MPRHWYQYRVCTAPSGVVPLTLTARGAAPVLRPAITISRITVVVRASFSDSNWVLALWSKIGESKRNGGRERNRTFTERKPRQILSLLRLPVPPRAHCFHILHGRVVSHGRRGQNRSGIDISGRVAPSCTDAANGSWTARFTLQTRTKKSRHNATIFCGEPYPSGNFPEWTFFCLELP